MIKDPDAKLDFGFDWRPDDDPWLEPDETILSYTLTVPTGITKIASSENNGRITVWLSGGTAKKWYNIACKINTSKARTDERTLDIKVLER